MSIIKIIVIVTCYLFMISCTNTKDQHVTLENGFSRSIDTLQNYISLQKYKPVNVMWKETRLGNDNSNRTLVPGPTDYTIEAFIQFDQTTAKKLKNDYKVVHDLNNRVSINEYWFKWLPKKMLFKNKLDSSSIYEANPFLKSPLLNGSYIFVNANSILIRLYTQ